MKNVGVREISRQTGFSPATVSNALNHKRGVNSSTAEVIIRTARTLGYERRGHVSNINFVMARKTGLVLDEGTFHTGVINGIAAKARAEGIQTSFMTLELGDRASAAAQAADIIHDTSSAVILLGTEMTEEDYDLFSNPETPLIVVDGTSDRIPLDAIVMSNETSSYRATRYLIDHGHREIGYIAGSYRIRNFPLRERGWRRAMREAGLQINPGYRVVVGTKPSTSYSDMLEWLGSNQDLPTAFFVENDIMAFGCMRALSERGLKVPDDVSLVGFDDLSFATIANPPLTTMHVPNQEMGEMAVQGILDQINKPSEYTRVMHIGTVLVERKSVRQL